MMDFPLEKLAVRTRKFLVAEKRKNLEKVRLPDAGLLLDIFSVLFFSSLKTEEAQPIRAHIFFINPKHKDAMDVDALRIERWQFFPIDPIPFTVPNLVKLAKAADPWSTGLAVYGTSKDDLCIWGIIDQLVHFNAGLVREGFGGYLLPGVFHALVTGPADITVMRSQDFIARLAQDSVVEYENNCLWKGPVYKMLCGWTAQRFRPLWNELGHLKEKDRWFSFFEGEWIRSLQRLLIHVQRQRHGGSILICPDASLPDISLKYALQYSRIADGVMQLTKQRMLLFSARDRIGYSASSNIYEQIHVTVPALVKVQHMLTGAIRCVSSFANVDGAVILDTQLEVKGFGAVLQAEVPIREVLVSNSESHKRASVVNVNRFGTRHGSMFRYCYKYPGTIGIVISQDGAIRVITRLRNDIVMFDNVSVRDFENLPMDSLVMPE